MKISARHLLLAAASLNLILSGIPSHAQGTPAPAPKFALLVGITDYHRDGVSKLDGCLNDVHDMKHKLMARFGFLLSNIATLENAQATHDAVVKAFRTQLLANARKYPNGNFLFYYSGHGSQAEDVNGDEKLSNPDDKADETLVTYDVDLVDDDIDTLCSEVRGVPGFTGNLTIILDSCHSGTATRDVPKPGAPHVREAPPDPKRVGKPVSSLRIEGNPLAGSETVLTGCSDTQSSTEDEFPKRDGKGMEYHGALTYFLLQAMDNATRTTSTSQLWAQVAQGINGARIDQSPQFEGNDGPFLGGSNQSAVPPANYTLAGSTLTFTKGTESGAIKGGFIAVYNQGKLQKQLTIASAVPGLATATVPADTTIAPTGTVELLTPYFGSSPLTVGLGPGVDAKNPVVKALAEYYGPDHAQFVQMDAENEHPNVYLIKTTRKEAYPGGVPKTNPPMIAVTDKNGTDPGYILSTAPGGRPIFNVFLVAEKDGSLGVESNSKDPSETERLQQTLEGFAAQSNLKALSNQAKGGVTPAQALQVTTFRVQGSSDNRKQWHTTSETKIQTSSTPNLKLGDHLQFELANQTDKKLYVALLWLSQDGSITPLQDVALQKVITLEPRGEDNNTKRTSVYTMEGIVGDESIKIFVSADPIHIEYLERPPIPPGRRGWGDVMGISPLDMIAGQAKGTRGPVLASDPLVFEDWGTETIPLTVAP